MIPTIANIRKAIYCLNKRIDLLEGGNYLDTMVELSNKISALESLLDDDSLNPTAAIDKFNEIVAFLESIENTDTLSGLLADISGKQDVIDSSHKLSSDLVDDTNKTHLFVTAEEKQTWNEKSNFSGSYSDLNNKPTIPDALILSDWNQTNNDAKDFIKNKPTIPTVPTNISSFNNDSHYVIENNIQTTVPSEYYVDMGLPSGTLWASRDIDLTKPGGFCETPFVYEKSFFSWGNIDGHNPTSVSSFAPYNWGGVNETEPYYANQPYGNTKGNTLTGNIAVGEDFDAARANLGAPWRMPTSAEYGELFANIKYINADGTEVDTTNVDKRVTVNGIVGLYIQSKINGARLFFSCSGNGNGASRNGRGSVGNYWSSTWGSSRRARYLSFGSGGVYPQDNNYRYYGFAVRAVTSQANLVGNTITKMERNIWNNKANIWRGTQAEYDLILTPDNNTIYIITSAS